MFFGDSRAVALSLSRQLGGNCSVGCWPDNRLNRGEGGGGGGEKGLLCNRTPFIFDVPTYELEDKTKATLHAEMNSGLNASLNGPVL